jgi:hypothetical protein
MRRGRRLADVVARGQPHGELSPVLDSAGQGFADQHLDVVGQPHVPQSTGHGAAVGHVPPQGQPVVGGSVVLPPRGPRGSREAVERLIEGRVGAVHGSSGQHAVAVMGGKSLSARC